MVFQCQIEDCGKLFSCKKTLKEHQRTHTGERPYVCSQCQTTFAQYSSLQKHQRVHDKKKPYICKFQDCNQAFSQISNLIRHERIHTGEKPYICNICKKKFASGSNLKQHVQVHDNDETRVQYKCYIPECGKGYLYISSLKKHIQVSHPNEYESDIKTNKIDLNDCREVIYDILNHQYHDDEEEKSQEIIVKQSQDSQVDIQVNNAITASQKQCNVTMLGKRKYQDEHGHIQQIPQRRKIRQNKKDKELQEQEGSNNISALIQNKIKSIPQHQHQQQNNISDNNLPHPHIHHNLKGHHKIESNYPESLSRQVLANNEQQQILQQPRVMIIKANNQENQMIHRNQSPAPEFSKFINSTSQQQDLKNISIDSAQIRAAIKKPIIQIQNNQTSQAQQSQQQQQQPSQQQQQQHQLSSQNSSIDLTQQINSIKQSLTPIIIPVQADKLQQQYQLILNPQQQNSQNPAFLQKRIIPDFLLSPGNHLSKQVVHNGQTKVVDVNSLSQKNSPTIQQAFQPFSQAQYQQQQQSQQQQPQYDYQQQFQTSQAAQNQFLQPPPQITYQQTSPLSQTQLQTIQQQQQYNHNSSQQLQQTYTQATPPQIQQQQLPQATLQQQQQQPVVVVHQTTLQPQQQIVPSGGSVISTVNQPIQQQVVSTIPQQQISSNNYNQIQQVIVQPTTVIDKDSTVDTTVYGKIKPNYGEIRESQQNEPQEQQQPTQRQLNSAPVDLQLHLMTEMQNLTSKLSSTAAPEQVSAFQSILNEFAQKAANLAQSFSQQIQEKLHNPPSKQSSREQSSNNNEMSEVHQKAMIIENNNVNTVNNNSNNSNSIHSGNGNGSGNNTMMNIPSNEKAQFESQTKQQIINQNANTEKDRSLMLFNNANNSNQDTLFNPTIMSASAMQESAKQIIKYEDQTSSNASVVSVGNPKSSDGGHDSQGSSSKRFKYQSQPLRVGGAAKNKIQEKPSPPKGSAPLVPSQFKINDISQGQEYLDFQTQRSDSFIKTNDSKNIKDIFDSQQKEDSLDKQQQDWFFNNQQNDQQQQQQQQQQSYYGQPQKSGCCSSSQNIRQEESSCCGGGGANGGSENCSSSVQDQSSTQSQQQQQYNYAIQKAQQLMKKVKQNGSNGDQEGGGCCSSGQKQQQQQSSSCACSGGSSQNLMGQNLNGLKIRGSNNQKPQTSQTSSHHSDLDQDEEAFMVEQMNRSGYDGDTFKEPYPVLNKTQSQLLNKNRDSTLMLFSKLPCIKTCMTKVSFSGDDRKNDQCKPQNNKAISFESLEDDFALQSATQLGTAACKHICDAQKLCPELLPSNCDDYYNKKCNCTVYCKKTLKFIQKFVKDETQVAEIEDLCNIQDQISLMVSQNGIKL